MFYMIIRFRRRSHALHGDFLILTITVNQLKQFDIVSIHYNILRVKHCNHFNCRIQQLQVEQSLKHNNCETAGNKFRYVFFHYTRHKILYLHYTCTKCGNIFKSCGHMKFVCFTNYHKGK